MYVLIYWISMLPQILTLFIFAKMCTSVPEKVCCSHQYIIKFEDCINNVLSCEENNANTVHLHVMHLRKHQKIVQLWTRLEAYWPIGILLSECLAEWFWGCMNTSVSQCLNILVWMRSLYEGAINMSVYHVWMLTWVVFISVQRHRTQMEFQTTQTCNPRGFWVNIH